ELKQNFLEKSKRKKATCFCKISCKDLTNQSATSGNDILLDITGEVGLIFNELFPEKPANQNECNKRCTEESAKYIKTQLFAAKACENCPDGAVINAYSAVGTKPYRSAQYIGQLVKKPEVKETICTCPKGWFSNKTQTDGGVTYEGAKSCKRISCQAINILPLPIDGTPLGDWGFTWGNALYAWGTPQNGGGSKCITRIISPAVCKIE
ncbi:MAG TPA: hypothetical protein PKY59_25575, partial [Pyrinomonadaceae bacterium]|nr:hypothetical protein [Pyrinomonadaceae bacterium]